MDIIYHIYNNGLSDKQFEELKEILIHNKHQIQSIMATVAEIQAQADALASQVTDLQTSVDTVQAAIAAAVAAFEQQIEDLKAQIAAGGTDPAALQAIADKLTVAKDALAAAKADLDATPTA